MPLKAVMNASALKNYRKPCHLKVTLNKKLCLSIALEVQLMNFFTGGENCVLLSRYLDFCVFHESASFKICYILMNITANWKIHFFVSLEPYLV